MLIPDIENRVKIGGFTLKVYAYRKITASEARKAAAQWLKANKRKAVPKSGEGKIVTIYGFDGL